MNVLALAARALLLSLLFAGSALAAEKVNINSADVATLDRVLLNVGASKAEAIVAYRKANGAFRSPEQLALVDGIGLKTVEKNRDRIVIDVQPAQLAASEGFDRSNWPFRPPLERASRLRGKNVKLNAGERGEIEDIVVNLGSGKVTGVIVAQDGRKGPEDKLTLPPKSLSLGKAE